MSKVIDFQNYKNTHPKNKVIEVDFTARVKKTVKIFSGSKLIKEIDTKLDKLKTINPNDPDGVA